MMAGITGLVAAAALPRRAFASFTDWSDVIPTVLKSVVRLETDGADGSGPSVLPGHHGSGFVIDPSGLVITNAHVIGRERSIRGKFTDGKTFMARVLDSQPLIDLAILQIEGPLKHFDALSFADVGRARIGNPVIAIGSPLDFPFSVTNGIISAFDRYFTDQQGIFLLQHDAALNPGNSGGPLIDRQGRVLGINTATPIETQYDIGIALAVPADIAKAYLEAVKLKGLYRYSSLGLRVRKIDRKMAALLGRDKPGNLLVEKVFPNSAAAVALMQAGDVITSMNGQSLIEPIALARMLWLTAPGEKVAVAIDRAGTPITLTLETQGSEENRDRVPVIQRFDKDIADTRAVANFGLKLGQIKLGSDASAVSVAEIVPESQAVEAGIQPGDILLQINGQALRDPSAAEAILADASVQQFLILLARQGAEQQYVVLSRRSKNQSQPGGYGAIF